MTKKAISYFLKDRWLTSLIYFATLFFIILFYQLTAGQKIEVVYPLAISFSGYILWMLIEGIQYIRFFSRLKKNLINAQYDLSPSTQFQLEISKTIHKIHRKYINQINEIKINQTEQNRFLTQWVHSFKTPIAVIDLLTQKSYVNQIKTFETITSISEENQKLDHNVELLLSLIRLGEFSGDYVPEAFDLGEELKVIINSLKKQFIMNHIFPELILEEEEAIIFSDKKWHRIMVEQFLSNAIKYSQAEENKKVWITLSSSEKHLVLTIKDEGIGIAEHDLFRIFEPFFTGDNGRIVKHATGVGLYIADLISKKLKHSIEVSSEAGIGTTVKILYNLKLN